MATVTNINDVLDGHVTLEVDCVDRLLLNAYVPNLQVAGQVARFLHDHLGNLLPSPALFGQITRTFKEELRAWCRARDIPWLEFTKAA